MYEVNCKVFFLADVLFFGNHLRLESSCILVTIVLECVFDQFSKCVSNSFFFKEVSLLMEVIDDVEG